MPTAPCSSAPTTLGTALGFKYRNRVRTSHAAVIVFVPRKMSDLPIDRRVPTTLSVEVDGVRCWCFTDVVVGGKANEYIDPPRPTSANVALAGRLQGVNKRLVGGVQIGGSFDVTGEDGVDRPQVFVGTIGCAVVDRDDPDIVGLLTNHHVAATRDRAIFQPAPDTPGSRKIGQTVRAFEEIDDEDHYHGLLDEPNASVRIDCAFVRLAPNEIANVAEGLHTIGPLGELMTISLESMDVIGTRVSSIGRTRGVQHGVVYAYSYEWHDEPSLSVYTDFLIISDDEHGVFSDRGDSGKLIITRDDRRPLALLWGGWDERLRHARGKENWTYAIDLSKVLDKLNVDLYDADLRRHRGELLRERRALGSGFSNSFVSQATLPVYNGQNASAWLAYEHFSLIMNTQRCTAIVVAQNVDGAKLVTTGSYSWRVDPRLPTSQQMDNRVYHNNEWDRGHLAQRAAVAWGDSDAEAERATEHSFYYTNAAPQHMHFNQDEWSALEDYILGVLALNRRASIYTGPVFKRDDTALRGFKIPMAFWKVVAFEDSTTRSLRCVAFLMKQSEMWNDRRGRRLLNLRAYQVSLGLIEQLTQLSFPRALHAVDPMPAPVTPAPSRLAALADDGVQAATSVDNSLDCVALLASASEMVIGGGANSAGEDEDADNDDVDDDDDDKVESESDNRRSKGKARTTKRARHTPPRS
jgi:DNA/RNA endonuclease G (NUC1)